MEGQPTNSFKPPFLIFLVIFLVYSYRLSFIFSQEGNAAPLYILSGGYIDDKKHSSWILQVGYKSGYLWRYLRPQATFMSSEYGSGFIGLGVGWECYLTKQILIIPSFTPGIYWHGKGKKLGCPLEFRSGLELAYELKNQIRLGIEIFHVSNAHLSHRNPGFNALIFNVAIPLNLTTPHW